MRLIDRAVLNREIGGRKFYNKLVGFLEWAEENHSITLKPFDPANNPSVDVDALVLEFFGVEPQSSRAKDEGGIN